MAKKQSAPAAPPSASNPPAPLGSAIGTLFVKIARSHPSYGYHPGETGELPAQQATDLIAGGFAELAVKPQDETR